MDLIAHLYRQRDFSLRTFGPGARTAGVCDHIRKELTEIEAAPADLSEWVDVILLGLDGAWRSGATPEAIAAAIAAKQARNEARKWPDWRTMPADRAIEHVRGEAEPAPAAAPTVDSGGLPVRLPVAIGEDLDRWSALLATPRRVGELDPAFRERLLEVLTARAGSAGTYAGPGVSPVEYLRGCGHHVEERDLPGLYRVDGGPEITSGQLWQFAQEAAAW